MKLFTYPLFLVTACLTILCACIENNSELKLGVQSAEELRIRLKYAEERTPMEYIKCEEVKMYPQRIMTRSGNWYYEAEYEPDGALFKGIIKNSSTLGRFKDAKINILFYSRTNTHIETQSYVIYEYLEPQSETSFSIRTDSYPSAYDSFRFEIIGASVAD